MLLHVAMQNHLKQLRYPDTITCKGLGISATFSESLNDQKFTTFHSTKLNTYFCKSEYVLKCNF